MIQHGGRNIEHKRVVIHDKNYAEHKDSQAIAKFGHAWM